MRYLSLLLCLFLCACGQPEPYRVRKNLSYGPLSEHTFDFYEPPYHTGLGRPLIIAIHGGAWQSGDKVWGENIAEQLCWRGFTVASINYRLAPEHVWPAQIEDCQLALQYFQQAAWMRIDNQRIAAFGHSAGGHLASMMLFRPPEEAFIPSFPLRIAISASGESDLLRLRDQDENLNALLQPNTPFNFTPEQLRDVSPISFIENSANTSLLLIHATGDTNVIYDHSQLLYTQLLQQGTDVQLRTLFSDNHNRSYEDGMSTAVSFLNARGLRPSSRQTKEFWRYERQINELR